MKAQAILRVALLVVIKEHEIHAGLFDRTRWGGGEVGLESELLREAVGGVDTACREGAQLHWLGSHGRPTELDIRGVDARLRSRAEGVSIFRGNHHCVL